MNIYLTRMHDGQTARGVFTNLNDAIDRQALECWYLNIHFWPFCLDICGPLTLRAR